MFSARAGIGRNVDMNELEVIASDPTCLHLFLLKDFEEVESLKYAIEKSTCEGTPFCVNNIRYDVIRKIIIKSMNISMFIENVLHHCILFVIVNSASDHQPGYERY